MILKVALEKVKVRVFVTFLFLNFYRVKLILVNINEVSSKLRGH